MNKCPIQVPFTVIGFLTAIIFVGSTVPVFATAKQQTIWLDLEQQGSAALDANEYWRAEPLLKKALAQATRIQPTDIRLAQTLGELGRLCTIRGRFDEAEAYLEEELSVKRIVWENDKSKLIPTMGSLIRFYLWHGTQDQALPLTAEMLYFVEGKMDQAKEGSIKNSFKKGQPLQGWLGSAAPVAVIPAVEWAVACDAVGNDYLRIENYQMADRFFKAGLDVKTMIFGKDHLSLANSYDSLGTLYLQKKDLAEAESYFTDALTITEKTLSPESHEAFNRLDKLAKCLMKEGKTRCGWLILFTQILGASGLEVLSMPPKLTLSIRGKPALLIPNATRSYIGPAIQSPSITKVPRGVPSFLK